MPNTDTAPRTSTYLRAALATLAVVGLLGCTGDIVGTVTTDFGNAVATSERSTSGDIDGWLTDPSGQVVYGQLDWRASKRELALTVAERSVPVEGTMDLDAVSLEELNVLLYSLWDIEAQAPEQPYCLSNELALCCRDAGWRCRAEAP